MLRDGLLEVFLLLSVSEDVFLEFFGSDGVLTLVKSGDILWWIELKFFLKDGEGLNILE